VKKPRSLTVVHDQDQKLGRPTIMDRTLAQKHGVAYVHLAAFAIDVDRAHELDPDDDSLPFAWEVALTDLYLTQRFAHEHKGRARAILEDVVLGILELPRPRDGDPGALGSQLPFAIYTALARGELPDELHACFRVWKKAPRDLVRAVSTLLEHPSDVVPAIDFCLQSQLTPPLVEPVRAALLELAEDLRPSSPPGVEPEP
jgi:hypothetical protein